MTHRLRAAVSFWVKSSRPTNCFRPFSYLCHRNATNSPPCGRDLVYLLSIPAEAPVSNSHTAEIEYAYERKFRRPDAPTFPIGGSILSILSLLFMTALSTIMLLQLLYPTEPIVSWSWLQPPAADGALAWWVWLPFAFTIFGAGLGFQFELALLVAGFPFQQLRTKFAAFLLHIRLLNLAPVTTTILFFVCCMTMENEGLRTASLYAAGGACFALGFGLFFGGAPALPMILLGIQVVQVLLVLVLGVVEGGSPVAVFLVAQGVLQLTALLVGTATPLKSTAFHVISTVSGILLYHAIVGATASDPAFSHQAAIALPAGSLLRWGFVAICLAGLLLATRAFPNAFNTFRATASNAVWSVLYFVLVSQKRFPNPYNLSEIYGRIGKPPPTKLRPYFMQHPEYLPEPLSVPAAEKLEANVKAFSQLLGTVKKLFKVLAVLDHNFPQADISVPLADKPRLEIWSDGTEYWPWLFTKNVFGKTIPGRDLQKTPGPAIEAYKDGQLLAYLTLSGVGAPFAKPAKGREGVLVSDFRFLERYQTKPEYHPYGGMAYFEVNSKKQKLELVSVVAPGSSVEILRDPKDPTFRLAESLVLASMYYQVISGKHLGEIHMTYNLLEVSLHNAFDAQGQWNHPFRTFMYLHLFSHELAEELTTEHLLQEGAVFSQVFATTHDGLINHLNDVYQAFEYGEDEDFDARKAAMTMRRCEDGSDAGLLPNACIAWELEYRDIWQRYAGTMIDAIYDDDAAVENDQYLQAFHQELQTLIPKKLPERYKGFQTKEGVSRFASDTIHHLVVRHQVYGTTGARAALDPRISSPQVPRDGGPPGVDEWRALASVALATGRARFTLLSGESDKCHRFNYLLHGVDKRYVQGDAGMAKAFDQLQTDLHDLDAKWDETDEDKRFNYDYFRPLPRDLRTGPGY